jgi:cysteine desulfuration protein SufE
MNIGPQQKENGIEMTIDEAQNRIIREMSDLDDWLDKYEYLIGLGKNHHSMDERYKTEENAIPSCQSNVWIHAEKNGDTLRFLADSDSVITKGLLALLLRVLDDRLPEEIASADLFFLTETGLSTHLSPSRATGLKSIVKRFKSYGSMLDTNK